jgi:predicted deacylase
LKQVIIAGHQIEPGEFTEININIARLPSHTIIETPIYVSRGLEDGPVLALTAGMHGDEINGMEIVRRMLDSGLHRPKRGVTVCMPIVNLYGFLNYSRDVPDGKDINRAFPGNKNGSLASRLAYNLMHEVIPYIDFGIDFHTGGAMRTNYPQVRSVLKDAINQELAQAFHAPFTIDAPFRPNSLRKEAARKGKHVIVYEGGESLRFDQQAIEEGIAGTLMLMKTAQCGQFVHKGDWVGTITDPFGEFKENIHAQSAGYVIGLNNIPVIHAGDALMLLGFDNFCRLDGPPISR